MTAVPKTVNVAFWILIALEVYRAATLVELLVGADLYSYLDEFTHSWAVRDSESEAPIALGVFSFIWSRALILSFVLFFVWVALLVRRGVNWARVVTTISAGAGLLYLFPPDFLTAGAAAANIVAVVLLWLPTSRAFFGAVRVERGLHKAGQLN
jgi:hypothetical protein